MDYKLTLRIQQIVAERGKEYAKRHGISLSQLVETSLLKLLEIEEISATASIPKELLKLKGLAGDSSEVSFNRWEDMEHKILNHE